MKTFRGYERILTVKYEQDEPTRSPGHDLKGGLMETDENYLIYI